MLILCNIFNITLLLTAFGVLFSTLLIFFFSDVIRLKIYSSLTFILEERIYILILYQHLLFQTIFFTFKIKTSGSDSKLHLNFISVKLFDNKKKKDKGNWK